VPPRNSLKLRSLALRAATIDGFVLAGQYRSAAERAPAGAVFGNIGTIVAFRVGASEAEVLAREFYPTRRADLLSLPNYHIYVKLLVDGMLRSRSVPRHYRQCHPDPKSLYAAATTVPAAEFDPTVAWPYAVLMRDDRDASTRSTSPPGTGEHHAAASAPCCLDGTGCPAVPFLVQSSNNS